VVSVDYDSLGGLEEYETCNWSYQDVMKKVGRLGVEAGVFAGSAERDVQDDLSSPKQFQWGASDGPPARQAHRYWDGHIFERGPSAQGRIFVPMRFA
jgi:hypothetical protein